MSRTTVKPFKSGPSRKPCYLRFINHTSRLVNIVWVDFRGYARIFASLHPEQSLDIHSYEGHPWICEDWRTRTPLLMNKQGVFYPTAAKDQTKSDEGGRFVVEEVSDDEFRDYEHYYNRPKKIKKRQYVHITLPVFSLAERSAEIITMHVRNVEDINTFRLPKLLKNMLQNVHFHPGV